jgi:hypothetical protein
LSRHFYDGCFKTLVRYTNACDTQELLSIDSLSLWFEDG